MVPRGNVPRYGVVPTRALSIVTCAPAGLLSIDTDTDVASSMEGACAGVGNSGAVGATVGAGVTASGCGVGAGTGEGAEIDAGEVESDFSDEPFVINTTTATIVTAAAPTVAAIQVLRAGGDSERATADAAPPRVVTFEVGRAAGDGRLMPERTSRPNSGTASIAATISSARCTRAAGSFSSNRWISTRIAGATSGAKVATSGAGRWICAASTSPTPSPTNGVRPVINLEQDAAQRVEIGALINGHAATLLGRHVTRRAHDRSRAGHVSLADVGGELRDAKVEDLDPFTRWQF